VLSPSHPLKRSSQDRLKRRKTVSAGRKNCFSSRERKRNERNENLRRK
jgi:hypothetical protein